MDIIFVTPSYSPYASQESIGSLILAKKAKMGGYAPKILRFWENMSINYSVFKDNIINNVLQNHPKIVSFYCRGEEYPIILDLANGIKALKPEIVILLGGPQAELTAIRTMEHNPAIDYICCGEGENTILPLLDYLLDKTLDKETTLPIESILGLVYRNQEGQIMRNKNPDLLPDNYSRNYNYYDLIPLKIIQNSQYLTIDVGRGCPFACTFCSTKTFWKQKYRLRNTADIINEISFVRKHFGKKIYSFSHDLFTANKTRIIDFCNKLSNLGEDIKWTCSSRIDRIDKELLDKMVDSGLVSIYYGIETGSQNMQKRINKNLNIRDCYDIVHYSIKRGLAVTTSFIYGFPDEAEEDVEQTFKLMHMFIAMGVNVQLHRLQFEPGTLLYEKYNEYLEFNSELVKMNYGIDALTNYIENEKELFSIYWNYTSKIRNELKSIEILHSIFKIYPIAYVSLFKNLSAKNITYYNLYKLFLNLLSGSINRFANNSIKLTKSIGMFTYLKISSKLSERKILLKLGITDDEAKSIVSEIRSLLK